MLVKPVTEGPVNVISVNTTKDVVDQDAIPEAVAQGLTLEVADQGLILEVLDKGLTLGAANLVVLATVLQRQAVVVRDHVTSVTVTMVMDLSTGVHIDIIMAPAIWVLQTEVL